MRFYVGTYTRIGGPGIAVCDLIENKLSLVSIANELGDPTYVILSKDKKRLYAVSSTSVDGEEGGAAAAYYIEGDKLILRSHYSTAGKSPCHLTCSPDERFLYVANYLSGSLAVFPITPFGIGRRIQLIQHTGKGPHPTRQEGPHQHQVTFIEGTNLLCAVDLGIDAVVTYKQNPETGLLTFAGRMDCEPGLGPRHLAYGKDGNSAYLLHELGNAVSVLHRKGDSWVTVQTLSTLPEDWEGNSTAAAIRVSEDGRKVFASNRGHDSIAVYNIKEAGLLELEGIFTTGGKIPRDFDLLPDGKILAAHQEEGGVALLKLEGGKLAPCCEPLPIKGAVCVCF